MKQALFHVLEYEMKNMDCLSPWIFYSTFIPDRDEGESWEKDGTAEGDTVTGKIIHKLYMGNCCLFNPRLKASEHIPVLMEVHSCPGPLGLCFGWALALLLIPQLWGHTSASAVTYFHYFMLHHEPVKRCCQVPPSEESRKYRNFSPLRRYEPWIFPLFLFLQFWSYRKAISPEMNVPL